MLDSQIPWEKRQFEKYKLNYVICGRGTPFIFFHGFGVSPESFKHLIETLSRKFLVIAPYMSEGWETEKSQTGYNFEDLVNIMEKLINSLNVSKHIILMGYSMGGLPATIFALRNENVDKLIIADGLVLKPNKSLLQLAIAITINLTLQAINPKTVRTTAGIVFDFIGNTFSHPIVIVNQALECRKTFKEETLLNFDTKTAIIWGENDNVLNPVNAVKLGKTVKNSSLKFIDGDHLWGCVGSKENLKELQALYE